MIFIRDITHPFHEPPAWLQLEWPWSRQEMAANLEGPLVQDTTSPSR